MMTDHSLQQLNNLAGQAAPLLERATGQASAIARRSVDAVRDGSQHIRDSALRASDSTARYVRDEPLRSILIAAVAGAALMALVGLFTRSRTSDRA